MLADAGCDLMFMPDVAEIYPAGLEHSTRVTVPELSGLLDGEFRPGHFDGVSTVVAKLFNIVMPDIAVFGEKDFQQLAIIRRMVSDLCVPIEIVGAPTVRESDGLAMSSRNQYLTAEERKVAPQLYAALTRAVKRLESGERDFTAIEKAENEAIKRFGFRPDYFTVRDAKTLLPPGADARHLVVLVAARLGKARLIDNLQFTG
jgi:pantoate--beta-alanine ligase